MSKTGPCWKCEKPTRSHLDTLFVYTPLGPARVDIFTCHDCWKGLKEGELTEHKNEIRDRIVKRAKTLAALQEQEDKAVRDEQDESGGHLVPTVWPSKR